MLFPYRDDNPTRSTPIVTILLITANVGVFVWSHVLASDTAGVLTDLGAIPGRLTGAARIPGGGAWAPLTMFTSMFLHGDLLHLLGNMWFLWLFGDNVEDRLGRFRYVAFYLLGGLAAMLAHVLSDPASAVPAIGASGAISAVLGAYVVLYPSANIRAVFFLVFYITVVHIPALVFIGVWFAFQVLSAGSGGSVAWWAHIGGFVAGIAMIALFGRWTRARRGRGRSFV